MARFFLVCALGAVATLGACHDRGSSATGSSGDSASSGAAGGSHPRHPVVGDGDDPGHGACAWKPYNDGLVGGYVAYVVYDPRVPGVAWAASGDHVYKSKDHGQTWTLAGEAPATVYQIALPVDSPAHLLVATSSGIASSVDGGETWTHALDGLAILSILAHPADPLRIYAGTLGAGILRSDDGGTTFYPVNYQLPYAGYRWLDGDPGNVDVVLVASEAVDATGNYETTGEILRTTDGGNSWTSTSGTFEAVARISRCTGTPTTLLAAGRDGVLGSKDGGQSWTAVLNEIDDADVAIAPSDCATVYRTHWGDGMYRSTDGGTTFVGPLTHGIPFVNSAPLEVSVDPTDPQRLLGATPGGLLYSADGGNDWSLVGGMMGLAVRALASSPTAPDRLWLATWGAQGFVREGTAPWARVPLDIDYQFTVAPDPSVADRTFFGAWSYPYVTHDGTTFTQASEPVNPMAFAFDPAGSKTVYMASELGGIYRSTDGQTWTSSSQGIAPWSDGNGTNVDFRSILVDATDGDRVLAGSYENGLWISSDAASSWTQVSALASFSWTNLVELTSGTPAIFATVTGHGVQRSTDGGATWIEVSTGLPTEDVVALVAEPAGDTLYASTPYGIFSSADRGASWAGLDTGCSPAKGFAQEALVTTPTGRQLVAVVAGGFGIYVHPI